MRISLAVEEIMVIEKEVQKNVVQQKQQVDINYILPSTNATFDLSSDAKSADKLTDEIDRRQIEITNARVLTPAPTLAKNGFGLTANNYQVSDYFNDEIVKQELYPQVIKHLLSLTGATTGLVFDHTLRSVEDSLQRSEKRSPINTVHNDYIASSAKARLDIELAKHQLSANHYQRYQFINTWIPLVDVVKDSPLAMADIRSFLPEQSIKLAVAYPDRMGEIEGFSYHQENRWYFYPDMTRHEQLNFKVFDSDAQNDLTRTPHSAISLPLTGENFTPRISIEVRSIVLSN